MNFYNDIIVTITNFFHTVLPDYKVDIPLPPSIPDGASSKAKEYAKSMEHINSHKARYLLEKLLEYQLRHIQVGSYSVFYSKELKERLDDVNDCGEYADVIHDIECDLRNSKNVNGRLSKRIDQLETKDLMLYEWNLYHFHLGKEKEKGGKFYQRTGKLLIAYILQDEYKVYFVDISESHGKESLAFCRQKYLNIIQRNWPELLCGYELKGITPIANFTDEQRNAIRKNGITCINLIEGKAFINPGGGISAGKSNIKITMSANKILQAVKEFEKKYQSDNEEDVDYKLDLSPNGGSFNISKIKKDGTTNICATISF